MSSPGTWRRKERERLAERLRDQSALCSEVMRRCCGGGGAGLGRVLGEGAQAAARGGVLCGRRGLGVRAPGWRERERETAAGGTRADLSAGPESRRLPPGPESKCYIKVLDGLDPGSRDRPGPARLGPPLALDTAPGRLRGAPARCVLRRKRVEGRITAG